MGDSPPEKAAGLLFPAPAAGEKAQGPDAAALGADSRGATHALDTAAALLAREQRHARGLEANKGRAGSPRLHHAPRGGGSDNDAASPALSVREGRTIGRRLTRRGTPAAGEAPADVLVVAPSLLDPHPVIVPPPGSRLSFAGANSARMARIFRSLPSLEDTLLRRAQEPLCLFNYWQYLADIEAGAEELEFWLSLADYEALFRKHRHFESPAGLSPASQAPQMLSPNPATLRSAAMQRNGRIESGALGGSSSLRGEPSDLLAQSLSQMRGPESVAFDAETRALDSHLAQLSWQTTKAALATACKAHRQCTLSHRPFTAAHVSGDPTLDTPTRASRVGGLRGFFSRIFSGEPGGRRRTMSTGHREPLLPHCEPPADGEAGAAPTEEEMQRAAERLYFHYFLLESPSPLRVSARLRDDIALCIERDHAFDAEVFVAAKRHAYEAMRHESHQRFLRERLFHNISRGTAAPRIVLGLALIFVALTFQLSLIFLDVQPKAWRWLPMAGLWPGFVCALAGVARLDPLMALAARYESAAWSFGRVRDKTVYLTHLKRALLLLLAATLVSAVISVVMFVVPGNRL